MSGIGHTPTDGMSRRSMLAAVTTTVALFSAARYSSVHAQTPGEPLSPWNDGAAKQAILDFVRATTDQASKDFVAPDDRIATFDQDGTLWVEHPVYSQAMFALDRVHELAPQHPEWQNREPLKAVIANNTAAIAHFTEGEWAEIIFLTHAGMSQEAFREIAGQWLATAKHPRFNRLYTDLTYQPMHEVMDYLRTNGFNTYIVSGFGQDFMRVYGQRVYGIPPEQIIGSSLTTKYEIENGKPELIRMPKLFFNCNFDGKVIGIDLFIGKRPYASSGNSTGDRQMLEWAGAGNGSRLRMLVYHDDPVREYAYGPAGGLPDTTVGTFDQALMDEAKSRGWTVISMKNDWKRIFAFE
jgi:phosphoglycolate phosphatase-like HAD superfamily hydrolase